MKVTFLGTGTSQGVPFIGCRCAVCTSNDKKDNRLRTAVWLHDNDTSVVIDSGPDFRYQMLRAGVEKLSAIVFTHGHKDHIAGLDDVRAFNYWQKGAIDIFANGQTVDALKREFSYVFTTEKYPGIPELNLHILDGSAFQVGNLVLQPVKVLHFKLEVYGYRVGKFTYITDANFISDEELEKIKGTEVLVLNALRHEPHISHFTLQEAIALSQKVGAKHTYFTHISHQLGLHSEVEKDLPQGMHLAYDGLEIEIE